MPIGDDAVDAGLEVVDPGADIRLAWQEINRTRDYLAVLMMRVPEFSTGFGPTARARLSCAAMTVTSAAMIPRM